MKKIISGQEFYDIYTAIQEGFSSEIIPGEPNHINDHIAIANRLNYFPNALEYIVTKEGANEWVVVMTNGFRAPTTDEGVDGFLAQMLYSRDAKGRFLVFYGPDSTFTSAAEASIGTELRLYVGALQLNEYLDALNTRVMELEALTNPE